MKNTKYRVVFDGPDENGVFVVSVGKYIRLLATRNDEQTKAEMARIANQRANIMMDVPDSTTVISCSCSGVVSARVVKEDLAGCVETETQ